MVKKTFIYFAAIVGIIIIYMSSTLSNRHTSLKYYRMFDFYRQLSSNFEAETSCRAPDSFELCFGRIIASSGGYQSSTDYGIALYIFLKKSEAFKLYDSPVFYRTNMTMIKLINPADFWIKKKSGESARKLLNEEKTELRDGFLKNRQTYAKKLKESSNAEASVALNELLKALDEKIAELER